jgi:hypothetical protein
VTTRILFDVADDCRSALVDILGTHAATWGAPELAVWLAGPYRRATRWARQSAPRRGTVGTSSAPPAAEGTLKEILASARRTAVFSIERLSRGDGAFVREAMATGIVVPRCDGDCGRIVPVDVLRMRLLDRVLSLAAADCLARPYDYTKRMTACTQCCIVTFGRPCEHATIGPPISGIQLKGAPVAAPNSGQARPAVPRPTPSRPNLVAAAPLKSLAGLPTGVKSKAIG